MENTKNSVEDILMVFWENQSWENFIPVLSALEGMISRRVNYLMNSFRGYTSKDDLMSEVNIFLFENIGRWTPEGGASIYSFVNNQVKFYLMNKLENYHQRGRILAYDSESEVVDKRYTSLYRLIEAVQDDLTRESQEFLKQILRDKKSSRDTLRMCIGEGSKNHVSWPRFHEMRGKFQRLIAEVQELSVRKNLKFS